MYKCIIFDVDGTLIDTEIPIIRSLQRILKEELNKDFEPEELYFAFGITGEAALKQLGVSDIERVNYQWNEYIKAMHHLIKPFDGVEKLLLELNTKGVETGIVTSKTRIELKDDFTPFGLNKYLKTIVCADDTKKHKPNPEPLLKFLELTNLKPHECLYIGDTIYDMHCATSAGVDFALALWGATELEGIEAKYFLKEPKEILEMI